MICKLLSAQTVGTADTATGKVVKVDDNFGKALVAAGNALQMDTYKNVDPAIVALATKEYGAVIPLAASTPVTLDVTALAQTTQAGDTAFATTFIVEIFNNEAIGSGHILTVGNDGSGGEFYDFIGAAAGVVTTIMPQCRRKFYTQETAGWTNGTRKKIKLDPGSTACECHVVIGGA